MLATDSCWLYARPGTVTRGKWRISDGKGESDMYDIRSSEGGNPCLCRLRTASVGPCCIKYWLCTGTYDIYGGPANWVASTVTELDNPLPRFTDDRRDSVRVTHGLPGEVFTWKTVLGRGRTRPDSLIVIMKGGHSCCLRGPRVSCCQVIALAMWLLIWISATPSDMGEACSLHPNVEVWTTLWLIWGLWVILTTL
jgi:hypothetical protein